MLIKTCLIFEVKVKALIGKYKNIFQTFVLPKGILGNFLYYKVVVMNNLTNKNLIGGFSFY